MDLRLSKKAVFFKDTFCLSKKKCTNGQNIHDTLVYGHKDPPQNGCLLQFSWKCVGFESKCCSALIVLAEIASATRNWDLYWQHQLALSYNDLFNWFFKASPHIVYSSQYRYQNWRTLMSSYSGAHEWVGDLTCAWLSQFFVTSQIEQCLHLDILISNNTHRKGKWHRKV